MGCSPRRTRIFILFSFYLWITEKELKKENKSLEKEVDKLQKQKYKIAKKLTRDKARHSACCLKKEVNKALLTALVAAFGFLIALSWKEVISLYVAQLTQSSPIQGQLVEAILVTIIAVAGILLVTKFLGEKSE